jgi:hypothetical protein
MAIARLPERRAPLANGHATAPHTTADRAAAPDQGLDDAESAFVTALRGCKFSPVA